jgi:hypothetical protein
MKRLLATWATRAFPRKGGWHKPLPLVLLESLLLATMGCRSIGPSTIPRDRFEYSTAMGESWKRQALLNIVKLRYMDPPSFVDVGQIVAGYTLETGGNVSGQVAKSGAGDTFIGAGGQVIFTDRPTITYTPLTGSRFVRGLMTPIPPESLFFAIQSGWPADAMLAVAAAAINGLRNEEVSLSGYRPAEPKFLRAAALMHQIQLSGAVGMKVLQDKDKRETKLITFRAKAVAPDTLRDIAELRELFGLDPEAQEFQLVFGATASTNREVAVQTRSLIHILGAMAARAEVPEKDILEGRAVPGVAQADETQKSKSHLRIRCSKDKPKDAFVAVEYRDQWFWLDDRDLVSKRAFAFTMILFTLADTGERESLPLITIPAQ